MSTQRTVVNQMVSQFGHGPDALAAAMGLSSAGLHNRRFGIKGQQLSEDELLTMQALSRSTLYAEYIASRSGGVFVALPSTGEVDNEELFRRQLALAKEVGALAALMESSLQNGSIDAGERNALYDEAGKLFRMAHELVGVAVMVYGE